MPATNPILPAFTPTAAREADRVSRKLSRDDARALLNRIERARRDEEIREMRAQLAEVEFEIKACRTEAERAPRKALAARIRAFLAATTGEVSR